MFIWKIENEELPEHLLKVKTLKINYCEWGNVYI